MARYSKPLQVSEEALRELEEYAQNNEDESKRKRAALVLEIAKGGTVMEVSERLNVRPNSILDWKKRYEENGLAGFENLPRGKSKDTYGADFDDRLRAAVMGPAPHGKYWTVPMLSDDLGAPADVIRRHLKKANINLAEMRLAAETEEAVPESRDPETPEETATPDNMTAQENTTSENANNTNPEENYLRDDVRITMERLNQFGKVLYEKSVILKNILADPDHFDVCTLLGFRRDFGVVEQGSIDGFFQLLKSFLEGYIMEVSKKKLTQNPDMESRWHAVYGEFTKFMMLALDTMTTELNPNEIIMSEAQEALTLIEITKPSQSYRAAAASLNRSQHRHGEDKIKSTTLHAFAERTALAIDETWAKQAERVLYYYGFDPKTGLRRYDGVLEMKIKIPEEVPHLDPKSVAEAIAKFNIGKDACAQIKNLDMIKRIELYPDKTIYILIDDIGVKRQLEVRNVHGHTSMKSAKNVENTVIYIQCGGQVRRIVSTDRDEAMKEALAVALVNGLAEGVPLVFFTDGAIVIKDSIEKYFGFYKYNLNLDWYHVEDHIYRIASMAFKGSKEFKRLINWEIKRRLWPGNYDDTVEYINSLNPKHVKSPEKFQELLAYLERKKPFLYCYALRKEEGYLNASSPVEKSNDLLVAQRQKHNSMSWSVLGSGALAIISALRLNGELSCWVKHRCTNVLVLRKFDPRIEERLEEEREEFAAQIAA